MRSAIIPFSLISAVTVRIPLSSGLSVSIDSDGTVYVRNLSSSAVVQNLFVEYKPIAHYKFLLTFLISDISVDCARVSALSSDLPCTFF